MNFASLEYIVFLPIVFILYWSLCNKNKHLQNGLIILASAIFYGWTDWRFLGLLLLTAFSTFFASAVVKNVRNGEKKRKLVFVGCLALNIGILFYFKYFNFFVESFADAFTLFGVSLSVSTLRIILPIGISFYTFTALSYVIDVYQQKIEPTRDILAYLAYVMFFPSILSGPISRAQKQLPQYLSNRSFKHRLIISGCKSILLGG